MRGMKMRDGLVVDLFAGGGGASTGLAWALGRDPDIAINHDRKLSPCIRPIIRELFISRMT